MSIRKKIITCNFYFVVMFLAAYTINRNFMIVATLIPTMFILLTREQQFALAEILFLLPFSATMTMRTETTSLFMIPKLAFIIKYFIMGNTKISVKIVSRLIVLFMYAVLTNIFQETFPLVRILNLLLWFFIGYLMIQMLPQSKCMDITCGTFVGGTIMTGVIGLMKEMFPNLASELTENQYRNELSGEIIDRFAGLWNDPNGYTIFLICALFATVWLMQNKKIGAIKFSFLSVLLSVLGVLTLSKSCALLLVGFWACFIVLNRSITITKKIGALTLVGAICLVAASFFTDTLSELIYRFTSARGSEGKFDVTLLTSNRSNLWVSYILAIFKGNFITGFGIDAPLVGTHAPHNTYIQLLYEWGMIGTVIYIWTWSAMLFETRKQKFNIIPTLFLLIAIFFLGCVYIEFLYFMLPLMVCCGKNQQGDITNIKTSRHFLDRDCDVKSKNAFFK